MKYIIDQTAWQDACNGIRCRECSMLDEMGACRIEKYISRQTVHEERPHGEWAQVMAKDGEYYCYHKCTNCGQIVESGFDNPPFFNFCPDCGADMRKEGDSDA